MESYRVSGYLRACISMFVCNRAVRWALCVFVTHSWRFILYDLSLSGAWVWWCCRDLLLFGHHFRGCHVHSWLYRNSAGKSLEFVSDTFILFCTLPFFTYNILTEKARARNEGYISVLSVSGSCHWFTLVAKLNRLDLFWPLLFFLSEDSRADRKGLTGSRGNDVQKMAQVAPCRSLSAWVVCSTRWALPLPHVLLIRLFIPMIFLLNGVQMSAIKQES